MWSFALTWTAGLALLPNIARADTITFAADQTIVSVGDPVTVRLVWTVSPLPRLSTSYTYKIPNGSSYVPNSVTLNGSALADTDPRVSVASDSIRVVLGGIAVGTTTVTLRLRAVGAIATGLPHFGSLATTGASVVNLRGYATRIEDESATVLLPTLLQDAFISQVESNYNYGGASQVEMRTTSERRAVLYFDFSSVALPGTHEVAAAYLEIFSAVNGGSGMSIDAFRLKKAWTEGTQTGAPCTAGVSWTKRDCFNSWSNGGDYDNSVRGSAFVDPATTFVSIDIKGLASDWLKGVDVNYGVLLQASGTSSNKSLFFPAKEAANVSARPARLVVVIAPKTAYTTKAVRDAKAEIVPNWVITNVPNQRFVYTFKPSFDAGDTGMNRVSIDIPSSFTFVSVDTVSAGGSPLVRNKDENLVAGEYEVFGTRPALEVRYAPAVTPATADKHVDIVFRAGTPMSADFFGKNFSSTVDHDRRGYALQSAVKGNANDRTGDGDTWLVRTSSASISSITVTPGDTSVSAGYSVPYRALVKYSNGSSADVTDFASWSVFPEIGTWQATPGLLRTTTAGDAGVTAGFSGLWSAPATLHVEPPALLQLWIAPHSASIVDGLTRQFDAYGRYSTDDTLRVTASASWSVADSTIARLTAPGLVRGENSGSTMLFASLSGQSAPPASVNVTPPQLVSIAISPADTSVALGYTAQLHAWGLYTDSSRTDLRSVVTWQANPTGILDIDADGRVRTLAVGQADITATYGAITSAPARFVVLPPALVSITIAPADTSVALGYGAQLRATGTYSNNSNSNITSSVLWSSSPPGIVAIASNGYTTTLAQGVAVIQASLGPITSPATSFTVLPPVLLQVAVTPPDTTVALGLPGRVRATGTYSNNAKSNLTQVATWMTAPPGIVSVDTSGSVTTLAPGSASITASYSGKTSPPANFNVVIVVPALDSLTVEPCPVNVPPGVRRRLTARGHYDDGSTADLTTHVIWSTGDASVAVVDSAGWLTAVQSGSTSVTAFLEGTASPSCSVLVDASVLTELTIVPADTTLRLGDTADYRAVGAVGEDAYDMTSLVTWTSTDTLVASIAATGIASTHGVGSVSIFAAFGPVLAPPATLVVDPPAVVAVEVLPASSTVRLGRTKLMTARARFSNSALVDVTSTAAWISNSPSIVYMDAAGVGTGLSLGTASLSATYAGVTSSAAALTVLPAVEVEALTTGTESVPPGALDKLLLTLRISNRYLDVRRLMALQVRASGPVTSLRLRVDDGDGIFEPQSEAIVASGVPSGTDWTATNLALDLPIAGNRTLFVSGDVSLSASSQGDSVDVVVPAVGSLFWESATAVTTAASFPLDSNGDLRVTGLVLAQMGLTAIPAARVIAGTSGHVVLEVAVPANGTRPDTLVSFAFNQAGNAISGSDITRMHLLMGPSPWTSVADLAYTGGQRWTASGLAIPVPPAGTSLRAVADIALTATTERVLRAQVPTLATGFSSGRFGPVDMSWTNPEALSIESPHTLIVEPSFVPATGLVSRSARQLPVLGLRLTAHAAVTDTLTRLDLVNTSSGPGGASSDPNSQISRVDLWLDTNADGTAGFGDILLESVVPSAGNTIVFGATGVLRLALANASPTTLLVTLDPDSTRARDAEQLSLAVAGGAALGSAADLAVQVIGTIGTLVPPIVDGQSNDGYAVRSIENRILLAGSGSFLLLDFAVPANGMDADVLTGIRIENAGSATNTDIASMELHRDDGNGTWDAADVAVATLTTSVDRRWETSTLALPLVPGAPDRFFVTARAAQEAQPGRTLQARVPIEGIQVASGNDGPNDGVLDGGGPIVLTAGNQVTWVAGVAGFHTVRPDARKQAILVLETLNGYSSARHLTSLVVASRGTATNSEFDTWALYPDTNQNGRIDDTEAALAVASPSSGMVRFEGFDYTIAPLQQQRLLVAYTLSPGGARDGSVVDAAIPNVEAFTYSDPGRTVTAAQFEMNSPGEDTIDGHVLRQIGNHPVTSQTLGGGETHVLALDLTLPSNGWGPDVLEALEVQIVPGPGAAIFGDDIAALRLWREQDTDVSAARFSPNEDVLLRSLLPGTTPLRFDALASAIPAGGHRFYVTADVVATPTDDRRIQMQVPIQGISVQSGNDGPLDEALVGSAIHHLSASDLLAAASVQQVPVSRGQILNLRVGARNRGSATLNGVVPLSLQWTPPLPVTLVSGPIPSSLTLASGESDTLAYEFTVDTAGVTQCTITVGLPDSTVVGNPASSPAITVQEPPSGLDLETLSNLPSTVSRGQTSVVPVIWNFTHPDTAALTAPVRVRSIRFDVETATGIAQAASAVFSRLELRAGGQQYALLGIVPDSSTVTMNLDPDLVLPPGEEADALLLATIAPTATASSFRIRLADASSVAAVDANSNQPVTVIASLPWTTNLASIRTEASQVDLTFERTLPASANRAQVGINAGRLTFALPGSAGESEARITQLALVFRDSGGQRLDPRAFLERLEVRSGAATLLSTTDIDTVAGRVLLPLTIQKSVASGAPEALDLLLNIRPDADAGPFTLYIPDAAALEVRDAISGSVLAIGTTAPDSLPLDLGSLAIQSPAPYVALAATSLVSAATVPGAVDFPVASFLLTHPGAPGTSDVLLGSLTFRTLDATGSGIEPRDLLVSARLLRSGTAIASVDAPPAGGTAVRFDLATPLRLTAGAAVDLDLEVDLSPSLVAPWIRFSFESTAFGVQDANDLARPLFVTGTIPFATSLVQVVQPTTLAAYGVAGDPPANAPRGAAGFALLTLRVAHPGSSAQAPLSVASVTLQMRDAAGNPLVAGAVAGAARLRAGSATFQATFAADSLRFDVTSLPMVDGGTWTDLLLELDFLATPAVSDLRLALDANGLAASSAGRTLAIQALQGTNLPYLSPSIHLTAANLEESFSNYPNPFVAGRESTRITFFLPEAAAVTAEVYALDGSRVVRLLDAAPLAAGLHDSLEWNGRNGAGQLVRNGTYLLRLQATGPRGGKLLRKLAVQR